MKWDYDVGHLRELANTGEAVEGDTIEALRAIAEQLERIADKLDAGVIQVRSPGIEARRDDRDEAGAERLSRAWKKAQAEVDLS